MFSGCDLCTNLWRDYARARARLSRLEKAFTAAAKRKKPDAAIDLLSEMDAAMTERLHTHRAIQRHALDRHRIRGSKPNVTPLTAATSA